MLFNNFFSCFAAFATIIAANIFANDPTISHGTLDNGLTYYVKENDEDKYGLVVQLVVKVGSATETDDEKGVTDILAQVASPENIDHRKLKIYNDACTGYTYTVYACDLSEYDDNTLTPQICLNKMLALISHTAFDASLTDEKIEKIKTEPVDTTCSYNRYHNEKLFKNTSFENKYPTISQEDLQKINGDTIRKFYSKWYHPKNMAVIIVGNINKDKTVEAIKKHFSIEPKNEFVQLPDYNLNKNYSGIVGIFNAPQEDPNFSSYYLELETYTPNISAEEYLKRHVLISVVLDIVKMKLRQNLDVNTALDMDINSFSDLINGIETTCLNLCGVENNLLSLLTYITQQFQLLKTSGVSYEDFDTIKNRHLHRLNQFLTWYHALGNWYCVDFYRQKFLENLSQNSLEEQYRLCQQMLTDLSLEECNNFMQQFFDVNKWSVFISLSGDSEKIDENEIRKIFSKKETDGDVK